jgi:adhesin transport system membrane fusion protein
MSDPAKSPSPPSPPPGVARPAGKFRAAASRAYAGLARSLLPLKPLAERIMKPLSVKLDQGLERYRDMPRPRVLVLTVTFITLALCLWAFLAPIDMVVRGQNGRIVSSEHNQVIQHLEGGIVAAISTREGAFVKRNQVLITIADVRANADLGEGRVKILGLRARVARLRAEAEGAASLQLPPDLPATEAAVVSEVGTFNARRSKLDQEISVLRQQAEQRRGELGEVLSRQKSLAAEFDLAQRQYQLVHGMFVRSAASQIEDLNAQAKVQDVTSRLAAANAMAPRLNAAIGEANAKIGEATSRFRSDARTDLTAAETDLAQQSEEIKSRSDRVSRSEVRAPMDGVVNRIFINTIGGVVKPGDPILEMTPTTDEVVIEARVLPTDRAELRTGLPTRVKVTAYDSGVYGSMRGVVTEISADTVPDERGERFERNYRVKIEVKKDAREGLTGLPLLPGMTATADIVVGRRTVWQYLWSPLRRFSQSALREPR